MSTTSRVPPSTRSGNPTATSRNWLNDVSRSVKQRPSAMIFYGPPGIGKTSLAASIKDVVFLIDRQEDGINRLKEAGIVPPEIGVLPAAEKWTDALEMLEQLRTGEHSFRALAVDAMGGFESLCHEEVCRRDYGDQMNERGFLSYARGYETALTDWRAFINALDRLRDERQMSVMLLGHAKVAPFKNPEGPDYDRYCVDVHHKTWSLTHKWADLVIFANYEVAFSKGDDAKQKAKAKGGKTRCMYTEYGAAFDAKNRHNLPEEIDMGNSGREAYSNLVAAIKAGRQAKKEGE